LQTAVQNQGMNMLNTILFQFVYGQMEPQRREILLQVIKYYQMKGAFGPQFANPHFANPNFLNIQDSVSPTSPTPSGGNGKNNVTTGGNGTGSGNLSVSPLPGREQRVPSPQEIAIHTQQIMQNALIKRKLEEQKEKAARQRQHQEVDRRSTDSPSFAFTPTVVMKKMAADRRDSDPKPVIPELKVSSQPSVAPSEKPAQPSGGGAINLQNRHSPGGIQGMMPPPRPMPPSAQQLLFMQQQIRAQQQLAAFQSGRPVDPRVLMHAQAIMGAAPPPGSVQGPPGGHAAGPRPLAPTSVPHFMPPDVMQHQQHQALHGHPAQGGLSRFFSPEVLAQAQSGNAPPLPPLPTQKAMTLEEIERQAAAVRM
jgi:translation initiation factor 4E transporter